MRKRFDQIGKKILRGALGPGGAIANELEVPRADAQAIDTWFEPAPERQAERERAGLLGRMACGPTMFEPFHDTPGIDDFRACLRKQLALDHARVLDAQKQDHRRPLFPQLWSFSSGRPGSILKGYGLKAMPGWPAGFYQGQEAEAVGVVVLRELPRERDTLLLRLMGAGSVLKKALAELARLPSDAWEREVAMPALLAARVAIPQDSTDESEREYLMSSQDLYEQWEQATIAKGLEKGLEKGAKRTLAMLYEARFGAIPPTIADAIEQTHDTAVLERWVVIVGTKSREEVAAAVRVGSTAPTS